MVAAPHTSWLAEPQMQADHASFACQTHRCRYSCQVLIVEVFSGALFVALRSVITAPQDRNQTSLSERSRQTHNREQATPAYARCFYVGGMGVPTSECLALLTVILLPCRLRDDKSFRLSLATCLEQRSSLAVEVACHSHLAATICLSETALANAA